MAGDGSRVRACALLVAVTLLVGIVPASGASTDTKLHRAQSDLGDLVSQIAEQAAIVADRERAVAGLAAAKARLDVRARALDGALAAQQATVQELRAAQEEQANALASEQAALAQLGQTRDRIVTLIARLKKRLHAEDVAAVARAFQGADHVSYGDWADLLLRIFDAPTCRENRVVVVAWQVQEFTQAAWNPLATTHRMPGSMDFNGAGVQDFVSLAQGLEATKETIQNVWDVYG